jgi:hypothetical protein
MGFSPSHFRIMSPHVFHHRSVFGFLFITLKLQYLHFLSRSVDLASTVQYRQNLHRPRFSFYFNYHLTQTTLPFWLPQETGKVGRNVGITVP